MSTKQDLINAIVENLKLNLNYTERAINKYTGQLDQEITATVKELNYNDNYLKIVIEYKINATLWGHTNWGDDARSSEISGFEYILPISSLNSLVKKGRGSTNLKLYYLHFSGIGTSERRLFKNELSGPPIIYPMYHYFDTKNILGYQENSPSDLNRLIELINLLNGEKTNQPKPDSNEEQKKKDQEFLNSSLKLDKEMKILGNKLSLLPKEERLSLIEKTNDILKTETNLQTTINKLAFLIKDFSKTIENSNSQIKKPDCSDVDKLPEPLSNYLFYENKVNFFHPGRDKECFYYAQFSNVDLALAVLKRNPNVKNIKLTPGSKMLFWQWEN
jgi:hypothetical protein